MQYLKPNVHKINCRKHAVARAKERYGVDITNDLQKIKKLIDKTIHRKPQLIFFKGGFYRVAYDVDLKEIVTVLPSFEADVLTALAPDYKWKKAIESKPL